MVKFLTFIFVLFERSSSIYSCLFYAAFGFGTLATVIAYMVSILPGSVIRIVVMVQGALGGPMLGVFILAFFFPWTSTKVTVI